MPRWLIYSSITIVFWGVWGFLGKLADIKVPMNPLVVQAYMTSGLVPAVILAGMSKSAWVGPNRKRGAVIAFVTGLIACLANTATYKAFTDGGPASIVLPVAAVYPILTVLVAWGFMGEKINALQVLGIAIGMAGVIILSLSAGGGSTHGLLGALRDAMGQRWMFWTLIALVAQAAAGVTQKLSTDDLSAEGSFVSFSVAFALVAIAIIALAPRLELPLHVGRNGWIVCLAIGLSVGFGVLASFGAYRHGKAAVVTPMTGLYPVVTTLLAVTILKEPFGVLPIVGTLLALGGAGAMSYEKRRPDTPDTPAAPARGFEVGPAK